MKKTPHLALAIDRVRTVLLEGAIDGVTQTKVWNRSSWWWKDKEEMLTTLNKLKERGYVTSMQIKIYITNKKGLEYSRGYGTAWRATDKMRNTQEIKL